MNFGEINGFFFNKEKSFKLNFYFPRGAGRGAPNAAPPGRKIRGEKGGRGPPAAQGGGGSTGGAPPGWEGGGFGARRPGGRRENHPGR